MRARSTPLIAGALALLAFAVGSPQSARGAVVPEDGLACTFAFGALHVNGDHGSFQFDALCHARDGDGTPSGLGYPARLWGAGSFTYGTGRAEDFACPYGSLDGTFDFVVYDGTTVAKATSGDIHLQSGYGAQAAVLGFPVYAGAAPGHFEMSNVSESGGRRGGAGAGTLQLGPGNGCGALAGSFVVYL